MTAERIPPGSRSCDICGHVGTDVSRALVRTAGKYEAIDRCRDHLACKDRLEGREEPKA